MSPAARKFEHAINLPVIASIHQVMGNLVVEKTANDYLPFEKLTIAHSAKSSFGLMKDWMKFTDILGVGILSKIS